MEEYWEKEYLKGCPNRRQEDVRTVETERKNTEINTKSEGIIKIQVKIGDTNKT